MTRRPIPAHGTTARAYGSPGRRARCNCDPCRTVRNRHQKQTRINRELGRSPFTSTDKARAHLIELHRTMSWDTLTAATGVHFSNLVAIYHGQRKKIRHETEAKILAAKAPTKGDGGQYIDVTGSTRRLQALSWLGHSYAMLAEAADTSPNRIMSIVNGRQPTIRRDLATRIAAMYPRLVTSPPTPSKFTTRTRNVARAKGWHGPLAWDAIDDPACEPETDGCTDYQRRHKAVIDPELVARLTAQGRTTEQIAAEIGCHVRSVIRARRRAEMEVAA